MRPLAVLLACLGILTGAAALDAAQVEVVKADKRTVQIGAGENRKIQVGMTGDVYQQTPPLIHPVTGENLGSYKIKVARIEIRKVGADYAVGRYLVRYAPVKPGDVVEGLELAPTPEEQMRSEVADARSEIKSVARTLAEEIKRNQRSIEGIRRTLRSISSSERRLNGIINDVRNVRERMVIIERRVGDLEDQQKAIIARDTAEVRAGTSAGELRVFRMDGTEQDGLPRTGNEPVYIQVGDRMYRLSFEENRADEVSPAGVGGSSAGAPPAAVAEAAEEAPLFEEEPQEEKGAVAWYIAYWWVAPMIGVLGVVIVFLFKMVGRRPEEEQVARADAAGDEAFIGAGDEEMIIEEEVMPELEEVETAEEET